MYLSTRNLSHFVAMDPDRRTVRYAGIGQHRLDAGTVHAVQAWPVTSQKNSLDSLLNDLDPKKTVCSHYFEVKIETCGETCKVAVGFARRHTASNVQLGHAPGTYCVQGENGNQLAGAPLKRNHQIFGIRRRNRRASTETNGTEEDAWMEDDELWDESEEEDDWNITRSTRNREFQQTMSEFTSPFEAGDTIGCGYIADTKEIFFTKNGSYLGIAFRDVHGPLFAAATVHGTGEKIKFVFEPPFEFDLEAHKEKVTQNIPSSSEKTKVSSKTIHSLVQEYLLHSGYAHSYFWFQHSLHGSRFTEFTHQVSHENLENVVKDYRQTSPSKDRQENQSMSDSQGVVALDCWSDDAFDNMCHTSNGSVNTESAASINGTSAARPPRPPHSTTYSQTKAISQAPDSASTSSISSTHMVDEQTPKKYFGMRLKGCGNPFNSPFSLLDNPPSSTNESKSLQNSHDTTTPERIAQIVFLPSTNNSTATVRSLFGTPPRMGNARNETVSIGSTNITPHTEPHTSEFSELVRSRMTPLLGSTQKTPLFGPMTNPASAARKYASNAPAAAEAAAKFAERRDELIRQSLSRNLSQSNHSHTNETEVNESNTMRNRISPLDMHSSGDTDPPNHTGRSRGWSLSLPSGALNSNNSSDQHLGSILTSSGFSQLYKHTQKRSNNSLNSNTTHADHIPFVPASPLLRASTVSPPTLYSNLASNSQVEYDAIHKWAQDASKHMSHHPIAMGFPITTPTSPTNAARKSNKMNGAQDASHVTSMDIDHTASMDREYSTTEDTDFTTSRGKSMDIDNPAANGASLNQSNSNLEEDYDVESVCSTDALDVILTHSAVNPEGISVLNVNGTTDGTSAQTESQRQNTRNHNSAHTAEQASTSSSENENDDDDSDDSNEDTSSAGSEAVPMLSEPSSTEQTNQEHSEQVQLRVPTHSNTSSTIHATSTDRVTSTSSILREGQYQTSHHRGAKRARDGIPIYRLDRLLTFADTTSIKQVTLSLRYQCRALIMDGKPELVLELLSSYAAPLVQHPRFNNRLSTCLHLQKSIELWKNDQIEDAWQVLQDEVMPLAASTFAPDMHHDAHVVLPAHLLRQLRATTALFISVQNIHEVDDMTPYTFLLSASFKDLVAEEVNSAILDFAMLFRAKQRAFHWQKLQDMPTSCTRVRSLSEPNLTVSKPGRTRGRTAARGHTTRTRRNLRTNHERDRNASVPNPLEAFSDMLALIPSLRPPNLDDELVDDNNFAGRVQINVREEITRLYASLRQIREERELSWYRRSSLRHSSRTSTANSSTSTNTQSSGEQYTEAEQSNSDQAIQTSRISTLDQINRGDNLLRSNIPSIEQTTQRTLLGTGIPLTPPQNVTTNPQGISSEIACTTKANTRSTDVEMGESTLSSTNAGSPWTTTETTTQSLLPSVSPLAHDSTGKTTKASTQMSQNSKKAQEKLGLHLTDAQIHSGMLPMSALERLIRHLLVCRALLDSDVTGLSISLE